MTSPLSQFPKHYGFIPEPNILASESAGNLEDITLRALRVLQSSDVIYSEDCRHTSKLTNHYGINTPRVSYHQHNEAKRNHELVARLQQGQTVALVSDAGCPGVSDPGSSAVVAAIAAGCAYNVKHNSRTQNSASCCLTVPQVCPIKAWFCCHQQPFVSTNTTTSVLNCIEYNLLISDSLYLVHNCCLCMCIGC